MRSQIQQDDSTNQITDRALLLTLPQLGCCSIQPLGRFQNESSRTGGGENRTHLQPTLTHKVDTRLLQRWWRIIEDTHIRWRSCKKHQGYSWNENDGPTRKKLRKSIETRVINESGEADDGTVNAQFLGKKAHLRKLAQIQVKNVKKCQKM
jgi:hypothetical protein